MYAADPPLSDTRRPRARRRAIATPHAFTPLDNLSETDHHLAVRSEDEHALAVELFNHAWTLMQRDDRSAAADDELLHCAHASRHHWGRVGGPEHRARGEWQCSRVYVVLGSGESAVHHARRCLELCEEHGLGDWALAYAYEALARAHRLTRAPR